MLAKAAQQMAGIGKPRFGGQPCQLRHASSCTACAALQADADLLQTPLHDPVMHGATHALMEHTGKVIFGQGHDLRQRGQAQGFAVGQMGIHIVKHLAPGRG